MYTVPETLVVAPSSQTTRLSSSPRRRSGGAVGSAGLAAGTSPGSNNTSPGVSPWGETGAPLGVTGIGSDAPPPKPLGTSTRGPSPGDPPALQATAALAAAARIHGVPLVVPLALMSHAPSFKPDTRNRPPPLLVARGPPFPP